jgi:large conductance mechanosensitive channel
MFREFKEFMSRGNLIELAVAVILGLAFNVVVQSLVADVFHADRRCLRRARLLLDHDPDRRRRRQDRQLPERADSFVIVGFVLFLVVKAYNRLLPRREEETAPTEVELLRQIRDELRVR